MQLGLVQLEEGAEKTMLDTLEVGLSLVLATCDMSYCTSMLVHCLYILSVYSYDCL